MGHQLIRPPPNDPAAPYVALFKFRTPALLVAWNACPERAALVRELLPMLREKSDRQQYSGAAAVTPGISSRQLRGGACACACCVWQLTLHNYHHHTLPTSTRLLPAAGSNGAKAHPRRGPPPVYRRILLIWINVYWAVLVASYSGLMTLWTGLGLPWLIGLVINLCISMYCSGTCPYTPPHVHLMTFDMLGGFPPVVHVLLYLAIPLSFRLLKRCMLAPSGKYTCEPLRSLNEGCCCFAPNPDIVQLRAQLESVTKENRALRMSHER